MAKKKRSLLERINPFDKESKERRSIRRGKRAGKKAAKATKGMVGFGYGVSSPSLKSKRRKIESARSKGVTTRGKVQGKGYELTDEVVKASGKIRKGAKEQVVTKGGVYQKYAKKSKAAGSFRSAFKSNCAGKGAGDTFSWDGRSYSCARKGDVGKGTGKQGPKTKAQTKRDSSPKVYT